MPATHRVRGATLCNRSIRFQFKSSIVAKRGRMRRCSHVKRKTGERCKNRLKAPKSKLRVFCNKHKKQHYHKHKTRVIVDKNNRINRKIERERKSQQPSD